MQHALVAATRLMKAQGVTDSVRSESCFGRRTDYSQKRPAHRKGASQDYLAN